MVLTITGSALAASANPSVSAAFNKNAKTVTITVCGESETFTGITNNTTTNFIVNGWEVNVTAKNDAAVVNSVKALAPAEVTPPSDENGGNTGSGLRVVEIEQSWSKTTFHCNTFNGKARVWPQVGPYNKNSDGKIFLVLEEIPGTTLWSLIDVKDAMGNSLGVPECPGKHQFCGSHEWVSFSNNSGLPDGKNIQLQHLVKGGDPLKASFNLQKTVEGVEFSIWLVEYLSQFDVSEWMAKTNELLEGISFKLFKSDGGFLADGELDSDGTIYFEWDDMVITKLPAGDYYITEALTGLAAVVFDDIGVFEFTIGANGKPVINTGFNYADVWQSFAPDGSLSVLYEVGDAYKVRTDYDPGYQYYPVNPWFADFYVVSSSGVRSPSFCSYWYSGMAAPNLVDKTGIRFAGDNAVNKANILAAFNYINNTWGSIDQWPIGKAPVPENATKMIAQVVLWLLLEDGVESATVISPGYEFINDCIAEVLANFNADDGKIVDVVFLAQEDFVLDNNGEYITRYQPQLVPVFGEFTLDNTPRDDDPLKGAVSFNKVKYGGRLPIDKINEFGFKLFKIEGGAETYVDTHYTDPMGKVYVDELDPGSYVFREVLSYDSTDHAGGSWRNVWNAIYPGGDNGLYFEITNAGATVWPDAYALDALGAPTVNNVFYCKHTLMWVPYDGWDHWLQEQLELGYIFFVDENDPEKGYFKFGDCNSNFIIYDELSAPADCLSSGWYWIACDNDAAHEFGGWQFGILVARPEGALGHNLAPWPGGFLSGYYGYFVNYCLNNNECHGHNNLGYSYDEDLWLEVFEANYGFPFNVLQFVATGDTINGDAIGVDETFALYVSLLDGEPVGNPYFPWVYSSKDIGITVVQQQVSPAMGALPLTAMAFAELPSVGLASAELPPAVDEGALDDETGAENEPADQDIVSEDGDSDVSDDDDADVDLSDAGDGDADVADDGDADVADDGDADVDAADGADDADASDNGDTDKADVIKPDDTSVDDGDTGDDAGDDD